VTEQRLLRRSVRCCNSMWQRPRPVWNACTPGGTLFGPAAAHCLRILIYGSLGPQLIKPIQCSECAATAGALCPRGTGRAGRSKASNSLSAARSERVRHRLVSLKSGWRSAWVAGKSTARANGRSLSSRLPCPWSFILEGRGTSTPPPYSRKRKSLFTSCDQRGI